MDFSINSLSIVDIAQGTSCPTKIYWKYLEVLKGSRPYTRAVSPVELGKKGEQDILSMNIPVDELAKKHFSIYDSMPTKLVELTTPKTKTQAEKLLKDVYGSIVQNISIIESIDHKPIDISYEISKIGLRVKTKYKLSVVIPKVSIYNPVYHYHGIPDFIGLKRDGSTIIIDSKNIERTKSYDDVQMNLYLDSFNKRYLTPSSLEEIPKVVDSILFQEKGKSYLKLLKKNEKSRRIYPQILQWRGTAIGHLGKWMGFEGDYSEGLSRFKYGTKIEEICERYEKIQVDIDSRLFDLHEDREKELLDIIMHQQPDYGVIFNTRHPDKTKEITEVTIDLAEITRSIWKIKKNLLTDNKEFIINSDSCSMCHYKKFCDKDFEMIEPEDIKDPAIPTLIHKAFKSYEMKEGKRINLVEEEGRYHKTYRFNSPALNEINESIKKNLGEYISRKYLKDYGDKNMQRIIDANKQLRRYAIAKKFNKINKEFKFWRIE